MSEDLFKTAFAELSGGIHKFVDPEVFGFAVKDIKIDKRSGTDVVEGKELYYIMGTTYYANDSKVDEIIYPPKALRTKLIKLFGETVIEDDTLGLSVVVPSCIGKNLLIGYEGKKMSNTRSGVAFHSFKYVKELREK